MFKSKEQKEWEARRAKVFDYRADLSDEAWPEEESAPASPPASTATVAKGSFLGALGAIIVYKHFSLTRIVVYFALFWPFLFGMVLYHTNCRPETFTKTQMVIWGIFIQVLLTPAMFLIFIRYI